MVPHLMVCFLGMKGNLLYEVQKIVILKHVTHDYFQLGMHIW